MPGLLQRVSGRLLIPTNTLHETNSEFTPENGWLEDYLLPFGARPIFRDYVSFRECVHIYRMSNSELIDLIGPML